jgi:hypothetical protein
MHFTEATKQNKSKEKLPLHSKVQNKLMPKWSTVCERKTRPTNPKDQMGFSTTTS